MDRAAVHLDDVTHDRQAQAEASGLARHAALGLAEPIEHKRQEVVADPDAGVADHDFDVRIDPLEPELDATALRRELHRIGQQVPDDLLQPIGIAGHGPDPGIDDGLETHALRIGGRLGGRDRVVEDHRQLHGLHVQTDLAGDDPRHVQDILDNLGQPRRVAFERLEPRVAFSRRMPPRSSRA